MHAGRLLRGSPLDNSFAGCVLGGKRSSSCISAPQGQHSRAEAGSAGGVLGLPDRIPQPQSGRRTRLHAAYGDAVHMAVMAKMLAWGTCMLLQGWPLQHEVLVPVHGCDVLLAVLTGQSQALDWEESFVIVRENSIAAACSRSRAGCAPPEPLACPAWRGAL